MIPMTDSNTLVLVIDIQEKLLPACPIPKTT